MELRVQERLRQGSRSLSLWGFKAVTGFFVGLTFALVIQKISGMGTLAFAAVVVFFIGAVLRISKNWSFTGVLIFNLFCIMVGLMLRMYILIAPGG